MEEGKILLIGNETDILHCGFSFPLSEGGKRYPSADHYAHSQILTQLGLDEVHILELLATPSSNVPQRAKELLQENMPAGHDMNSLAQYLMTSRQSYTMAGLRLRAEQDKSKYLKKSSYYFYLEFRQALMDTSDALLIVCDCRDNELSVGMNDEEFVAFTRQINGDAEKISQWMHDERTRPCEIGQNQLGFFLMWLRYEIKEKERAKWLTTNDVKAKGISTDQDDKPIEISVSDFIISLQGIFQPLSNYYAMNFEIKGESYRSVEHYAYQRLFESLKLQFSDVMKIRTTVKPVDVAKLAKKVLKSLNLEEADLEHKINRLDRWRQSAMKHKISKNELLQQLLLSTGHAILIETTIEGDPQWSSCTDEFEIQHLLTKKYITPQLLIDWMCGRVNLPFSINYLGGNKTGLLLMELRTKFSVGCTHRIPLVSPLTSNVIRTSVSNHMICFTPESVLHPFYSCEIKINSDSEALPSPIHSVAHTTIKFFNICKEDSDWILETKFGPECWSRLNYIITEKIMPSIEKIQQWYMTERQNALKYAMRLQFEQNPALLRILLDTNDALLISCARFSSLEAELNIGMRERDLRLWLSHVRVDAKGMIDLCLRPMAFRPPYLGGNRLGIMLMEIRRDFILKGVFPQRLLELPISVDAALGSDSPMENYVPHYTFDVLDEINYNAIWANSFLLMIKQDLLSTDYWPKAISKKSPPTLISMDDIAINNMLNELIFRAKEERQSCNHIENGENINNYIGMFLDEQTPEVMRAVFIKLSAIIKNKITEDEEIQKLISKKSKENSRMQEIRRAVDRPRDSSTSVNLLKDSSISNYLWSTGSNSLRQNISHLNKNTISSSSISPSRNRNDDKSINSQTAINLLKSGKIPSLLNNFATPSSSSSFSDLEKSFEKEFGKILPKLAAGGLGGFNAAVAAVFDSQVNKKQGFYGNNLPSFNRNYDERSGKQYGRRHPLSTANRSPSPSSYYRSKLHDDNKRSNQKRYDNNQGFSQQNFGINGNQKIDSITSEEKPPVAKKPKRIIDESELSEGEILSDDDEELL